MGMIFSCEFVNQYNFFHKCLSFLREVCIEEGQEGKEHNIKKKEREREGN